MKRYWRSLLLPVAGIGLAFTSACSSGVGAPNPPVDLAADAEADALAPQTRSTEPLPLLELVSRGGVGRLYTLNEREASSAETAHGMTRQPGQVGYMPARQIEGTTPLYRLKPSANSNRWLLTSSSRERDTLTSQDWVYEGIVGYVYTDPGAGRETLNRFTNGHEWRMSLDSEIEGYRLDGMVGHVDVNGNA